MNAQAARYINRIKNPHKRDYALAYYEWMRQGETGPEPPRGNLGALAAQDAKMSLQIIKVEVDA
jgi:hypothetical protein